MDTIDAIELRTFRILDAVARHRNFSEAGRELGIPRALVSKTVAELERTLGCKLFRRTTRKVGLTPAGSALLIRCNKPVVALRDALLSARTRTAETAGTIRFSVSHAYGRKFILPVLPQFRKAHPRIQIECVLNDALDDLVLKSLDFSIRMGPLPANAKSTRILERLDVVFAAHSAFANQIRSVRKIDDILRMPTIGFRLPGSGGIMPWLLTKPGIRKSLDISGAAIIVNSIEAVADLVKAGVGIAPVPRYLVEDGLKSGKVISVLNSYQFQDIVSFTVMPDLDIVPTRIKLLIDAIEKSIQQTPG